MVTDDQEKKLHARAKANLPEEEKWREMYRVLFPDEKVPSPCMASSYSYLKVNTL